MTTPPRSAAVTDLQPLFQLYSARRFQEMAHLARTLLGRFPHDGNVWKALSVAQQMQGLDAVPALEQAIALLPRDAELPSNLGALLSDVGRLDEAVASYHRSLAIKPDFADAHANLGVALTRMGRFDEAIASLRRALQLKPGFAAAHYNLANALMGRDEPQAALQHYDQALALHPALHQAERGRAHALRVLGRLDEAAAGLRRALARAPDTAAWHVELGNIYTDLGRADNAIAAFQAAVRLQPDDLAALANLGAALHHAGRGREAVGVLRQAIALDPGAVAVLNNLGNALIATNEPQAALLQYRRAIALAPADLQARHNLARALRGLGQVDEALDQLRQVVAQAPDDLTAHSDLLFIQNYMDHLPDAVRLADARAFGARAAAHARPYAAWPNAAGATLRVGIVSGDLRTHPIGYFAQHVLVALAERGAGRIALYVYANSATEDAVSARIQAVCHAWRRIDGQDDATAAAQIHADGIGILIDLAGHTARNRLPLFAWRPAPVQVSWLGYCATTGMAAMDHVLTDPWIVPPGAEGQYVEHIWRLPETFLCFTPPDLDISVGALPALAAQGRITFGCFNSLNKVNADVIALWSRVLAAVPGSRLLLKAAQLDAAATRAQIAADFGAQGIDPDRLLFEGATPRAAYLEAYHRVDIALDPFPYPGGTTSVEGFWMGVPVLTLPGHRPLSRQGASILHNLDLTDWIATDADDFVARAVRHASDLQALSALRHDLRARLLASPLCDAPRFADHFHAALAGMWERHTAAPPAA